MPNLDSQNAASLRAVRLSALGLALALVGCGGPQREDIIPLLPKDGDAHTAKPPPLPPAPPAPVDPWDRDDLIAAPKAKAAKAYELPPVERFSLTNGLEVVVVANDRVPIVSMQLAIKAGSRTIPRDKMGLEHFTAAMLTKGTRTRNALQIAEQSDRIGATLFANATSDATLINCSALNQHLRRCATLLADVAVNPIFPKEQIELVRRQLLGSIQQRKENAGIMATAHMHNLLWGDEHVRGWPMSARTLMEIKRQDLRRWYQRYFAPNNALLIVSGAVDPQKVRTEMQRAFRWWQSRKLPKDKSFEDPTVSGTRVRLVHKPGQTQTHIRIAQLGIAHKDPVFYDYQVFNYVLGGGAFTSRLLQSVRSKAGKTYSVSSTFERSRERGAFIVSTFTRGEATMAIIELILREMDKMQKEGPTEPEVQAAVSYLAGSYVTQFESPADVGRSILAAELHQLGPSYVRDYPVSVAKVTRESAGRVAAGAIDLNKLAIVLVGDASVLEPQLEQVGWKYEKVHYQAPIASWERPAPVVASANPGSQAAARALIEKAVKAKGGAAKMRAVKSMTVNAKGQIVAQGRKLPAVFTRRYVVPDRLRMDIEFNFGGGKANVITVLDRSTAWNQQPGQGTIALPPEAVTEFRKQLWRDHEFILLHALDKGSKLQSLGEKSQGGMTFDVVQVTRADDQVSATVYLDKKTHLMVLLTYNDQGVEASEAFGDYRTVNGIKVAHKRQTNGPDATLQVEVTSVKFDQTIDDAIFAQPK